MHCVHGDIITYYRTVDSQSVGKITGKWQQTSRVNNSRMEMETISAITCSAFSGLPFLTTTACLRARDRNLIKSFGREHAKAPNVSCFVEFRGYLQRSNTVRMKVLRLTAYS